MSTWIMVLKQLAALLGITKGADDRGIGAAGYPPFTSAVRSKILVGPTSYAIKFNPQYMSTLNPNEGIESRSKTLNKPTSRSSLRKVAWGED